jgi:hypothetical protein
MQINSKQAWNITLYCRNALPSFKRNYYTQKLLELGLTAPTFDHCATRLGRQYSADKIEKHWIIPSNTIPT